MNWPEYLKLRGRSVVYLADGRTTLTDGFLAIDAPAAHLPVSAGLTGGFLSRGASIPTREDILGLLDSPIPAERITERVSDLRAWLPACAPGHRACYDCDGCGEICCPDERCNHRHPCSGCEGTGETTSLPRPQPVEILGLPIDGILLHQLLSVFDPDSSVELRVVERPNGPALIVVGSEARGVLRDMNVKGTVEKVWRGEERAATLDKHELTAPEDSK